MERTTWETVFAIIVGVVLGTLVAISIWFVKTGRINLNFASQMTKTVVTPTPISSPQSPFTLLISQPHDGSVTSDQKITVAGKTERFARVIVSQNNQDTIARADQDGLFKVNLTLDEADNEILVTSMAKNGETKQETLIIVYQKK